MVNNRQNPLRLNVGYMYNKPIGTIRDVTIEFGHLKIEDLLIKDLNSIVRISRTREGLLLQVEGESKVETACVRCLERFFLPIEFEFEELYQFPSRHREAGDLILPNDGYIDLKSLFREYLILAMPINPFCKPDCKGLCVICGANLNRIICEHQTRGYLLQDITEGE